MGQSIQEWTEKNMWKTAFKHLKRYGLPICLGRPCQFRFFNGCLAQILVGSFLNTLSHNRVTFPFLFAALNYSYFVEVTW